MFFNLIQRGPRLTLTCFSVSLALAPCLDAQCEVPSLAKLMVQDGGENDFLRPVAIDGDWLMTASPTHDGRGAVYVHQWDGVRWQAVQELTAADGQDGDSFGVSLALDGDVLAVGAHTSDARGEKSGAVSLFRRIDGVWIEQQKLAPADIDEGDLFGLSLTLAPGRLVVGAPLDDHGELGYRRGSAYVYLFDRDQWTLNQRLEAQDPEDGDYFGMELACSGDTLLIGAPSDDHGVFEWDRGTVSAYTWEGGQFAFQQTLPAEGLNSGDGFGFELAIDGDRAAASLQGEQGRSAVVLFEREHDGWREVGRRSTGAVWDRYGHHLAMDGGRLVIGSPNVDVDAADSGQVEVFRTDVSGWPQEARLVAQDRPAGRWFGSDVALDGGRVVARAPNDSERGPSAGAAYAFALEGFALSASATVVQPGDRLRLMGSEGIPEAPSVLLLTDVDGQPFVLPLAFPTIDTAGSWSVDLGIDNPLGRSFGVTFQAWSMGLCGKLVATDLVDVRIDP